MVQTEHNGPRVECNMNGTSVVQVSVQAVFLSNYKRKNGVLCGCGQVLRSSMAVETIIVELLTCDKKEQKTFVSQFNISMLNHMCIIMFLPFLPRSRRAQSTDAGFVTFTCDKRNRKHSSVTNKHHTQITMINHTSCFYHSCTGVGSVPCSIHRSRASGQQIMMSSSRASLLHLRQTEQNAFISSQLTYQW